MSILEKKDIDDLKGLLEGIHKTNDERAEAQKKTNEESGESIGKITDQIAEFEKKFTILEKREARENPELKDSRGKEICFKSMNEHIQKMNEAKGARSKGEITSDNFLEIKAAYQKAICIGRDSLSIEESKTLNTIVDPSGGYFALPEMSGTILSKAFDGQGVMGIVNTQTTGSSVWEEIIDLSDYEDAEYFNELDAAGGTSDNEDFRLLSYHPKEQIYGKKFSRTALEDAFINFETYIMQKLREGSDRDTATDIISGVKQDTPRGILTYPAGTSFGNIEQITSGTSGVLKWADVINLLPSSLSDRYHNNSSYAMRRSSFFGLLADTDGNARFQVSEHVNLFSGKGVSLSIMGAPVVWESGMAAVAADGLAVAYGDFVQGYNLINRIGFSIIRDETNPKFIELFLRRRNTGDVRNFEALKILKIKS